MKKIFLIVCFFNVFWSLSAQVDVHPWAPLGAVWLYKAIVCTQNALFEGQCGVKKRPCVTFAV